MKFNVLFLGQIPKEIYFPDSSEDIVIVNESLGRIAVSDGASESFHSKAWAKILAERYVKNPRFNVSSLTLAIKAYKKMHDISQMSWAQQNAYERGSFASLLGVSCSEKRESLKILAVGDTEAVLLSSDGTNKYFPYSSADEFNTRPLLFSSEHRHNIFYESPSRFQVTWKDFDKTHAILLCVTDALAEWAFGAEGRWSRLAGLRYEWEFHRLVLEERMAGKMRLDDTTLLTLSFC